MNEISIKIVRAANGCIVSLNPVDGNTPANEDIFVFESGSSLTQWLIDKLATAFVTPQ
jgi:hypothetical protein